LKGGAPLPLLALCLASCAMYPKQPQKLALRQLTVEVRLASPMEPNYFYFVALDLDDGSEPDDGPVPILNGPPWGNGWGAISGTGNKEEPGYYVVWHLGAPVQFILGQERGRPYQWEISDGGKLLTVTVDIGQVEDVLGRRLSRIDLNIITTDVVVQNPAYEGEKWTDALGEGGTSYIRRLPLNVDRDYYNSHTPEPEGEGDVLDRSGRRVGGVRAAPLDIVDWHIRVRTGG